MVLIKKIKFSNKNKKKYNQFSAGSFEIDEINPKKGEKQAVKGSFSLYSLYTTDHATVNLDYI